MKLKSLTAIAIVVAAPSFAANSGISVEFRESAPKDSFVITNSGACPINGTITIDLAKSAGGLIFDTTPNGAGVEVFQPFEMVTGSQFLTNSPVISDGDKVIGLEIKNFAAGGKISFTIDVDDTLKNSALGQIRVADNEISGAVVQVNQGMNKEAYFESNALAQLVIGSCTVS